MEASDRGLSAGVMTNYLRLTDEVMRLRALSSLIAPSQIVAHCIDAIEWAALDVAPFQRVVRIAPPLLQRSGRAPDDRGYFQCRQIRAARQRIDIEHRGRRHATVLATALLSTRHFPISWQPKYLDPSVFVLAAHASARTMIGLRQ
jgi:hypothetical protein